MDADSIGNKYLGVPIPVYTSIEEEYCSLVENVAIVDRSGVGRLWCRGEDALDLINRLSTNQMIGLSPNKGVATVLTSNKGRIIDVLSIFNFDNDLFVQASPFASEKIVKWINFYTIMESVNVDDVTTETSMMSLIGPNSSNVLKDLIDLDFSLELYEGKQISLNGIDTIVCRSDFAFPDAYDFIVEKHNLDALWEMFRTVGVMSVGSKALDLLRIEQGNPSYTRELTDSYNPLESGLRKYISFNKGCYIGQEVIARLDAYKKVQKYLVGLEWESTCKINSLTGLFKDNDQVGLITSWSVSPKDKKNIGLGYVRKANAIAGELLQSDNEDIVYVKSVF